MAKTDIGFSTIRTEGQLFPSELLQKISQVDSSVPGLRPEDYHLGSGERLNEVVTRSWNRMTGVWRSFREYVRSQLTSTGTTETRERWLLPLFSELGYGRLQSQKSVEIDGKSYPISHKATEPVALYLVSHKWEIDKRNELARGETRLSPHSMMQEFLNRSDNHLWGIVSNGLRLRLLRDNLSLIRTAHVEFDLESMFENEVYSDFFLLYLICHQSRLEVRTDGEGEHRGPESCWLETWYESSVTEGIRLREDLRNGVHDAIETIGTGLISNKHNVELRERLRDKSLDGRELYAQILRLVYRLIFIFVSEERDLLQPEETPEELKLVYRQYYSTARIRTLAGKKRGTRHSDLWEQLNIVFTALHQGNAAMGLPALGSFLFAPESTQNINGCRLSNHDLLKAIRLLCYTQKHNLFQPVSYRNLGSEEMGSVYESLLEMIPDIDIEAGYFKLIVLPGNLKKTTASYYTPAPLVHCLLDSALEPVIESKLRDPDLFPEQALLSIKIVDPACGSGHFLVAAAHRVAKRLAAIRSGEEEPTPAAFQHALREVIGHCIYGVDLNQMAVELCKITLWMEALEPGKPLTFLDHHIQCGNSLLGCSPELLDGGIPDAAYTPFTGDDKAFCSRFKKLNKDESKGSVIDIFSSEREDWQEKMLLKPGIRDVNEMSDDNLARLQAKEQVYADFIRSQEYQNAKLACDAWCAAFVWIKNGDPGRPMPVTHGIMESIKSDPDNVDIALKQEVRRLAEEYHFFHWHLAFPDVFPLNDNSSLAKPGFDCVLGNPPWERVKLQEKEFFAARDLDIANAPNAAARKRLIDALPTSNPKLYREFQSEKRIAEGSSLLIRESGRYPLCGRGDVNTYTVFAELNRILLSDHKRCGCIVPSGISTDDTTKFFFQDLTDTGSLVSLYDFENREKLFPAVDSRMKFCLLTLRAAQITHNIPLTSHQPADFVFFAHAIADLSDEQRHFQLSAEDIALINPNTRTCPIFRSKQDAELTKYIYRRVPVLINENDPEHGNPWGISFMRMFDMSNDSHLFRTKKQLEEKGFELQGNHFVKGEERYLPLYEAKMIHHYNHRFGDYADLPEGSDSTQLPDVPLSRLLNPGYEPLPRYWVLESVVCQIAPKKNGCWLGFRDITNTTNERTVITSFIPYSAVSNKMPLLNNKKSAVENLFLNTCFNSYAGDFVSRFKVGATSLNFFIAKQLAVLPPSAFETLDSLLTTHRLPLTALILELIYTSHSLKPLAKDCGYDGPPFIWDEERRFEIKCELDALFFHLYLGTQSDWGSAPTQPAKMADGSLKPDIKDAQCTRGGITSTTHHLPLTTHPSSLTAYFPTPLHAVEYIMETFPIVKRKDEREYGEYRTKRRILEIYDAMTPLFEIGNHTTLRTYRSPLNPPPGPPCDKDGNFIPVDLWEKNKWPKHIHNSNKEMN